MKAFKIHLQIKIKPILHKSYNVFRRLIHFKGLYSHRGGGFPRRPILQLRSVRSPLTIYWISRLIYLVFIYCACMCGYIWRRVFISEHFVRLTTLRIRNVIYNCHNPQTHPHAWAHTCRGRATFGNNIWNEWATLGGSCLKDFSLPTVGRRLISLMLLLLLLLLTLRFAAQIQFRLIVNKTFRSVFDEMTRAPRNMNTKYVASISYVWLLIKPTFVELRFITKLFEYDPVLHVKHLLSACRTWTPTWCRQQRFHSHAWHKTRIAIHSSPPHGAPFQTYKSGSE